MLLFFFPGDLPTLDLSAYAGVLVLVHWVAMLLFYTVTVGIDLLCVCA